VLDKFLRFKQENGIYLALTAALRACRGAVRNHFLSQKLEVKKIQVGARSYLRGLSCMQIGEDLLAGPGLWLEAIVRFNDQKFTPKIVIGDHVRISHNVHIAATHHVEIGDHVLMGSKVIITDHNHGHYSGKIQSSPETAPTLRELDHDQTVSIGRNVWLADGVVVTPGSSIGEGSVIAANSVIIGAIPPFSLAAGAPAKVRKVFDFVKSEWRPVAETTSSASPNSGNIW
jgi:lipopolysaccharide O-acetyltransferase